MAHVHAAGPFTGDPLFLRGRVLRLRSPEGPAPAHRRRLRRRHPAQLLHAGARAAASGRQARDLGNVLAALFGIATPFCSCSAVPLFIGFVTAGVPLGVTFSFLDLRADGERGRARAAVRPLRLEGRRALPRHGARHRDRRRLGHRRVWNSSASVEPWVCKIQSGQRRAGRRPRLAATASLRPRGASARSSGRSGSTSSPASPSAPASTDGSRPTSWRRSWARTPGGPFRSPC